MKSFTIRFFWFALGLCAAAGAMAQDADMDGIPDAAEAVLGGNPNAPEQFITLWERSAAKAGKAPADPSRTIKSVAIANAGGNRFIWRVEFLAAYPQANSSLLLYLDADDNKATGRQPGHGCEFMLHCGNGAPGVTAYTPDGKTRSASPPRIVLHENNVFYSYDVDLAQRDGASVFRLSVLSETTMPHQGVDSIGYFEAKGPAISGKPKIALESDLTESVGVEQTWGLERINALMEDAANVPIWIRDCKLDGFRFDKSEYRADNALRSGGASGAGAASAGSAITATVPKGAEGKFHVGFIFYDTGGCELIGVYTGGQKRGVAVADFNDNNQHLFFTTEPIVLKPGDQIQLRPLVGAGSYRTEDLVLLRRKPEARSPLYELREIAATGNRLTWITSWATACAIEYGADAKKIVEPMATQNHRVALPDVKPGDSVRYRITAQTRDGREVTSGWREFTWKPFSEPKSTKNMIFALRVEPPAELAGKLGEWPVTGGIPFPQGAFGSARNIRLHDSPVDAARPKPMQTTVAARWPDGSIKWLLLDFRHSGGPAQYSLICSPDIYRSEPELKPAPLPELGELILTDAAGKEHKASMTNLTLEEEGGLRRCLRGSGRIGKSAFSFSVRVHVYPGLPYARALMTFGYDASPDEFTTVRSLAWRLPAMRGEPRFVRQHTDDHFDSSEGGGKRLAGAVGAIFVRDFWQNYPKDIEMGRDGLTLWLMPRLKPGEYDWAKGKFEEHKLFFWFDVAGGGGQGSGQGSGQKSGQDGQGSAQAGGLVGGYKLRQGMTKTHEVWLGLDGSAPPLDHPLMAVAPPRWYADSGAFGEITIADPNRALVKDYDKKVNDTLDVYLKDREKIREYGMFNFGDWWGERVINWGNIEYDTQHAFFLQFARSGDLRFLRAGEEAEIHNRDVDTVHYHTQPERVGCVYAHCIGHIGDYLKQSPLEGKDRGTPRGGFSVSHTWCEGHLDHYFLTGDRRSYETALEIADHYDSYRMANYDFTNCRDSGWHLILTMAAYRATGDPYYLNAARIITERVLERQTPKPKFNTAGGGWRRMMVPGHCLCEPAHYGNAGFMVGVLLTGLKLYHLETSDPRVAQSIIMGARFLVDDIWVEDIGGFRYTSCPVSSKGAWSNFLLDDGIGYAYRLTQKEGKPDAKLAHVLQKGAAPALAGMSGMGKSFTQYIRVAPHFIGLLSELLEKQP
ncbi:MAG: hypothetical protein NTX50_01295 [Candidatus Sumerlaeota bacterium]|nr:hypothetical protein [Candidatus Sumerlaeota bacterium]